LVRDAGAPRALVIPRERKHRGEPYLAAWALRTVGMDVSICDRPMHRRAFLALFRAHDLYLHLSRPEGFPGPVIEAFGAGCLVAGFAGVGGLHFMRHGDNCLLAEDGDWRRVVEQATALRNVAADAVDAMLASARATAARFDEAALARRLREVWSSPIEVAR
jgi:glycosyltransferase involved in cell wall biosynthesis